MLRLLLTRRWVAWLCLTAVVCVACLFLGRWQWHRWESRHAAQTTVNQNYDASPVSPASVLPTRTSDLPDDQQWRQVRMTGRYLTDDQLLVRNRPLDGDFGFEVVLPMRLDDGRTILVDRGWVPNGPSARQGPTVPKPPTGRLTVTGWLRPGEPDLKRAPVSGQVASINLPLVERTTGEAIDTGAYVRMRGERTASGATPERPVAFGKPDQGMAAGINLSYALQWWAAAIAFPVFVLLAARREARGPQERPAKPKKVRIWDEEDA